MTRPQDVLYRLLTVGTLGMAVLGACGGRSSDHRDVAVGGSPLVAGNGAGGADSKAGRGGSVAGGNSSAGGSIGIAWPPECSASADSGSCLAFDPSWYLDIATGICKPFVYGGCEGNTNRYESRDACQAACANTNPSYDHCEVASDCVVGGPDCCGVCDRSDVTADSLIAYARQYEAEVQQSCGGTTCGGCPEPVSGHSLKYFVPGCVNHQCTVTDIRRGRVSSCTTDQDCLLRYGTGCCPSCDPNQLVAISNHQLLQELVCDGDQLCPAIGCDPIFDGAVPFCEDGHCAVRFAGAPIAIN